MVDEAKYYSIYDNFQTRTPRNRDVLVWAKNLANLEAPILDLGSGTGNLTKLLFDSGAQEVVVIDPNEAAMQILQSKCADYTSKLRTHLETSEVLSRTQQYRGYFQTAISLLTLPFPDDPQAFLNDIYGCLSSDGSFVCSAWLSNPNLFERVFLESERELGASESDEAWATFKQNGRLLVDLIIEKGFTIEGYKDLVSKAGFTDIEDHPNSYGGDILYTFTARK